MTETYGRGILAVDFELLVSGSEALKSPTVREERARIKVSELMPPMTAHAVGLRPGSCAVDWTTWGDDLLVAFDPAWFTAEQAVAVARLVLGRRIHLAQAVAR